MKFATWLAKPDLKEQVGLPNLACWHMIIIFDLLKIGNDQTSINLKGCLNLCMRSCYFKPCTKLVAQEVRCEIQQNLHKPHFVIAVRIEAFKISQPPPEFWQVFRC